MTDELVVISADGERRWSREAMASLSDGDQVGVGALVGDVGDATHASFETATLDYRASIPLEVVREQAMIVHARDGRPLSADTGGPFRLLVRGGSTLCWNVKGVARVRLTEGPESDSVPENPPH